MSLLGNKNENNSEKEKKPKKKRELFSPIQKREKANENIFIENSTVFPNIGKVGQNKHITYIGHPKPVIKLILIKTFKYPNNICSLSIDGKIKIWSINDNVVTYIKSIEAGFETWDIIYGTNNNIIICGEQIMIIDLDTENKITIQGKKLFKFVEFNLLAKINYDVGVCTSLNDYYLLFDINKGNIIKKIEMNKTHFICQMEKNIKIQIEEEKKKKEESKNESNDFFNETEEENKKKKRKKEIKKIIRDIGSGKCEEYENGHKGHVYALLGINIEEIKDSIISGGEDNIIKIIDINNERNVINLLGHTNTIKSLVLDKSQKYLYSGSLDYTIKKWDLIKKECINTMEYNRAYQDILLSMDNYYLLSIGINSKIQIWNEDSIFVKNYKYSYSSIKSANIISYDKEFNKTKFIFGDEKGNIFIKNFIIGDSYINKYQDYLSKSKKESEEKLIPNKRNNKSVFKSMVKFNIKDKDFAKNFNFKEITYETETTEY